MHILLNSLVMISMPSGGEWLWIILLVIVFFGGKKIPELARGLGKGMREFKDAKQGIEKEITAGMESKSDSKTV